jgi:site-specific recombinase XerD
MAMPAPRLVHSDSWLDTVAIDYERALLRQNLSPATVRIYGTAIKNFFAFARDQGVDDLHDADRNLIERWQDALRNRTPPLRASSRSLYSTSVRQLLRWAAERDIVDWRLEKAIVGVRTRHNLPRPIPPADLAQLKAYLGPRRPRMTALELRDRAMFYFFLTSAARVSEALQVRRRDFERARVVQKGGTEKELRIPPTVVEMVNDYLAARRDDLPWLWIAHGNNVNAVRKLADSGVREAWRRLCYLLGIDRFTTHQLRHTAITELLDRGIGELAIADHAGHHGLQTIHNYGQVRTHAREQLLDAMEDLAQPAQAGFVKQLQRRSRPGGRPRYGLR